MIRRHNLPESVPFAQELFFLLIMATLARMKLLGHSAFL